MAGENDGWNEWSKYVLKELERLDKSIRELILEVRANREDVLALKIKAGLIGAGASVPPCSIISALIAYYVG